MVFWAIELVCSSSEGKRNPAEWTQCYFDEKNWVALGSESDVVMVHRKDGKATFQAIGHREDVPWLRIGPISAISASCDWKSDAAPPGNWKNSSTRRNSGLKTPTIGRFELPGVGSCTVWDYPPGRLAPQGTLEFTFPPMADLPKHSTAWVGTTAGFVRFYTMPNHQSEMGGVPLSNTCGLLLDVVK
jgi:hypothetical protein